MRDPNYDAILVRDPECNCIIILVWDPGGDGNLGRYLGGEVKLGAEPRGSYSKYLV